MALRPVEKAWEKAARRAVSGLAILGLVGLGANSASLSPAYAQSAKDRRAQSIMVVPPVAPLPAPDAQPPKKFTSDECGSIFTTASDVIGKYAKFAKDDVRRGKLKKGTTVSDDTVFQTEFTSFFAPNVSDPKDFNDIKDIIFKGTFATADDKVLARLIPLITCEGPRTIGYTFEDSNTAFEGVASELLAPAINISFAQAKVVAKRKAGVPAASTTPSPGERRGDVVMPFRVAASRSAQRPGIPFALIAA